MGMGTWEVHVRDRGWERMLVVVFFLFWLSRWGISLDGESGVGCLGMYGR